MKRPIYLDHNATTPLDPRVLEAMMPYLTNEFGNAASRQHPYGWVAEKAVERAREQVAALVGCTPKEIYFLSGGTEANNLVLRGLKFSRLVTSLAEHKSVLETATAVGFPVDFAELDSYGRVAPEKLKVSADSLVSLMWANNEVGTLNDVEALSEVAHAGGAIFHTDAVQVLGRVDIQRTSVDLMSFSAHKIYGPKGVGALYVRRKSPRIRVEPQISGGGHELGLRSGTLNVPAIVGFGRACEIMGQDRVAEHTRLSKLRDFMLQLIKSQVPDMILNGHPTERLPHNLSLTFPGVTSAQLMADLLKDIAISTGSACLSQSSSAGGFGGASHVLKALGLSDELGGSTVRLGLGRSTTEEDARVAAEKIVSSVLKRRK